MKSEPMYNINLVSRLTGISLHTLRTWEKRYSVVRPKRLANGRRQYSLKELDHLWILSELVKLGFTIGLIVKYDIEVLEKLYRQQTGKNFANKLSLKLVENPKEDLEKFQNVMLKALDNYKLNIISNELSKVLKTVDPKSLGLKILSPLMEKIGKQVLNGQINMAQEHAISALIRFHVGHLFLGPQNTRKKKITKIILSTPSDELHEFGIIISALLCHFYSIEFMFLGTNLPARSIADTLEATKYDMVIFGTTRKKKISEVKKLSKYFDELLNLISKKKRIIIGGPKILDGSFYKTYKNLIHIHNFEELDRYLHEIE